MRRQLEVLFLLLFCGQVLAQPQAEQLEERLATATGRDRLGERHSLEELPVIFLTAKNQVPDLVAGLAAGGNDYLAKPIGKDELLARVRTHLELLSVHRRLATKNAELAPHG